MLKFRKNGKVKGGTLLPRSFEAADEGSQWSSGARNEDEG